MSQSAAFSRISLTLPPEVLAEADRLARELDRSRSWVIAEAIRRLVGEGGATLASPPAPDGSRLASVRADMACSPTERVAIGERLAAAGPGQAPGDRDQLLAFRSYQAYLMWDSRTGGRP